MEQITNNIYYIGDAGCSVFLVDTGHEEGLVLIDAGMDISLIQDIESVNLRFDRIRHCILTHCHIDHIAVCHDLARALPGIRFYAHEHDARPIEHAGYDARTAASWYGIAYRPVPLSRRFSADTTLALGSVELHCIHTPGHTPGSLSVWMASDNKTVLFGQDLHGPFNTDFESDLEDYQLSMDKLLALNADILCEGHFGIFKGRNKVRQYIERHKTQNRP